MSKYFEIDGEKLSRNFEACPKCGPGYFIGKHSDRTVCGTCGYTKFKSGKGRKRRK